MSALLDELYFEWLYGQVGSVKRRDPSRTHWELLKILFTTEFIWMVPNDDNRVEDGRDLRYEFLDEKEMETTDKDWLSLGCSMLELLISLSRRLSFEDGQTVRAWFWELLKNIGLADYNDSVPIPRGLIEETLNRVIWRTYKYNGSGGLFPLKRPKQDQRGVELWYQLSAYLLERD